MSVSMSLCVFVCSLHLPKRLGFMSLDFEGWFPLECKWFKVKKTHSESASPPENPKKNSNSSGKCPLLDSALLFFGSWTLWIFNDFFLSDITCTIFWRLSMDLILTDYWLAMSRIFLQNMGKYHSVEYFNSDRFQACNVQNISPDHR